MMSFAEPLLFEFEVSSSANLTFIPMAVRYNLDRCGRRISLEDWQALPHAERRQLACLPLARTAAQVMLATTALDATMALHRRPVQHFPPDPQMPWDAPQAPDAVQAQCRLAGLPALSVDEWAGLDEFKRYVLVKLSRKAQANHDFAAAMAEFGSTPFA